jgi:hypothetical protein
MPLRQTIGISLTLLMASAGAMAKSPDKNIPLIRRANLSFLLMLITASAHAQCPLRTAAVLTRRRATVSALVTRHPLSVSSAALPPRRRRGLLHHRRLALCRPRLERARLR